MRMSGAFLLFAPKKERESVTSSTNNPVSPVEDEQKAAKKEGAKLGSTLDLNTFPLRGDILHLPVFRRETEKERERRSRMKLETPI